jgi:predicted DNA-binding transcriptional regulator AlpA
MTWELPVGAEEIAARLGVPRQTVYTWRHRDVFLEPKGTVGGRPAWDWPDVAEWARSRPSLQGHLGTDSPG